jgi:hypothetical protein
MTTIRPEAATSPDDDAPHPPHVQIVDAALGEFLPVASLNPSFRPRALKLRLVLEVAWSPPRAAAALIGLQGRLLELLPTFRRHTCRAPAEYGICSPAFTAGSRIEAPLALAHTLEHVMIDTIACVTRAPSISGVTAAFPGCDELFDLFVECPDPLLARLATHVALVDVVDLLDADTAPMPLLPLLELARDCYESGSRPIDPLRSARRLGRTDAGIDRDFATLVEIGFLRRSSQPGPAFAREFELCGR